MKNYHIYFFGILFLVLIHSCVSVPSGSDVATNQKAYVQDDLYDTQVVFSRKKENKKDFYNSPNDFDEIVIEEEEGVANATRQQNFLNSRSVYSNYDQGYSDGFRNGVFTSTPWNNWYSNPYLNFGYSPFRSGLSISWGLGNLYNPWNNFYPYSAFGMGYGLSSIGWYDPFFDPFYRYAIPSYAYFPGYYGQVYNPYNYYSYLNSSSGYVYQGNNNASIEQPQRRVVRGPREETSGGNRYNENYAGGGRNAVNQYNGNFKNQGQQQTQNIQEQRNVAQEYQRVQPRRNSSIEYSRPSNNDYQNSNRDQFFQQNRTTNFGNSSSGSNFSGGGSFQGGGSRGPR